MSITPSWSKGAILPRSGGHVTTGPDEELLNLAGNLIRFDEHFGALRAAEYGPTAEEVSPFIAATTR